MTKLSLAESVLTRVGDVEEPIFILVLLIDAAHEGSSRGKDLVDKDEDGLLGGELDSLADNVDELAYGQVGWDQIFLLIDGSDITLLDLLADHRNTVGVFLTDALGLSLSLLEGVLVLEFAAHGDGSDGTRVMSRKAGCSGSSGIFGNAADA